MISGNMVGSYSQIGKTFILVDDEGNEITGVCVDNPVVFTANATEDIRQGKVAATDEGVVIGSKVIPAYTVWTGKKLIKSGSEFAITLSSQNGYDYTEIQCIICPFNTSINDSVITEWVVIGDNIYTTASADAVSTLTKNSENKTIVFNMTNSSNLNYIIRYYVYKMTG